MVVMIVILPFSLIVMKTAIMDEMHVSIVLDLHWGFVSFSAYEFSFLLSDLYF